MCRWLDVDGSCFFQHTSPRKKNVVRCAPLRLFSFVEFWGSELSSKARRNVSACSTSLRGKDLPKVSWANDDPPCCRWFCSSTLVGAVSSRSVWCCVQFWVLCSHGCWGVDLLFLPTGVASRPSVCGVGFRYYLAYVGQPCRHDRSHASFRV